MSDDYTIGQDGDEFVLRVKGAEVLRATKEQFILSILAFSAYLTDNARQILSL